VIDTEQRGWPIYHRSPCHRCGVCGKDGCVVWNNDTPIMVEYRIFDCGCINRAVSTGEIHACANGCDGPLWEWSC